jgi:outer membrane protein TolC
MTFSLRCTTGLCAAGVLLFSLLSDAQQAGTPNATVGQPSTTSQTSTSQGLSVELQQTEQTTALPSSERAKGLGEPTFWNTWSAHSVEPLSLQNSERLGSLIVNGTLYLSLHDMIQLTVENNLDVEVQRYQLSISGTDVLRAKGGGVTRGLPLTIQQAPVGIGGPGGTLLNQAAAAGAVSPTPSTISNVFDVNQLAEAQTNLSVQGNIPFSTGPAVPVYDPNLTGTLAWVRREPGVSGSGGLTPLVTTDNGLANLFLYQGFSTGLQAQAGVSNINDINLSNLTYADPFRHPNLVFQASQPLLRGGGFNVNRRYIKISQNNQKVSRLVFRQQLVDLIYGVSRLYYDLVSLNEDVQVKKETLAAAQQLYNDDKAQVEVGTLAPLELSRVEALVASAELDLTRSQGLVQQQAAVVKSMISRTGSADPQLQAAKIFPTDVIVVPQREETPSAEQLIQQGLSNRADLAQAGIQVENGEITVKASRNNVRPEIDAVGAVQSHGAIGYTGFTPIGGVPLPPTTTGVSQASVYEAGVQLNLPFRNRIAQADAARDEMQLRQMQARVQQLANQIRDEIENAAIAVDVARTAYAAAVRSRMYQEQLLQAEKEKLSVGASTNFFIVQDESYLAQARSTEVVARSTYIKSRVALQRALGTLVEDSGIQLDDAIRDQLPPSPAPAIPATQQTTTAPQTSQPQ